MTLIEMKDHRVDKKPWWKNETEPVTTDLLIWQFNRFVSLKAQ